MQRIYQSGKRYLNLALASANAKVGTKEYLSKSCLRSLTPTRLYGKIPVISSVLRYDLNYQQRSWNRFISIVQCGHTSQHGSTKLEKVQPYHHDEHSFHNTFPYKLLGALGLILTSTYHDDGNNDGHHKKQWRPVDLQLFSAVRDQDLTRVKSLISKGADVNCVHPLGWTPLMVAAANGYSEVVQVLLDSGAEVNTQDEYTTPFEMARRLQKPGGQWASNLLQRREDEFADYLTSMESFRGMTSLHYAALASSQESVKLLIEANADPTLFNCHGHKATVYASGDQMKATLVDAENKWSSRCKRMEAEERRKFPMEQQLKQHIIGQQGAINAVSSAVRRKLNGWTDDDHPLVFLFLGSSGIGKTELAKRLASYLHPPKNSSTNQQSSSRQSHQGKGQGEKTTKRGFLRFDMSEYQEKHEVAKFIGAPPGYVGFSDGGQLTESLRKSPDAVVLFDEVEKAHPDVLTCLLQLFDEGRLTDGKGETIECKDAIFVMTSNLASEEIAKHAIELRKQSQLESRIKAGEESGSAGAIDDVTISRDFKDKVIRPILKAALKRDEFLGRINEFVYFLPFSQSELIALVKKELDFWARKAQSTHQIHLSWDHSVMDVLATGYDVHYGARSIKHEVERCVIAKIALAYEQQVIRSGSSVKLVVNRKLGERQPFVELLLKNGEEWSPLDLTAAAKAQKLP